MCYLPLFYSCIFIKIINTQELFTSSAELQQIIHVEKEIPKIIQNYISLENKRLEELKMYFIRFNKIYSKINCVAKLSVIEDIKTF